MRPKVRGHTVDERAAWESLHKIEYDRLLTTRGMTSPSHSPTPRVLMNLV